MNNVHTFVWGFFAVIALFIVFVSAGKQSGTSGGTQTAQIASGIGNSLAGLGSSLETGNYNAS